jgi:ATP-dependent DNA ligase
VVRTLEGKLRIGASMKTVLQALAHAFALTDPSTAERDGGGRESRPVGGATSGERKKVEAAMAVAAAAIRDVYSRHPNLADLCAALWKLQERYDY